MKFKIRCYTLTELQANVWVSQWGRMFEGLLSINFMLLVLIGVFAAIITANIMAALMNVVLSAVIKIKGL